MPITLCYNKLKTLVRFKKSFSEVPLADLVEEASIFTSTPTHAIKLIFAGAVMKNLEASLSSYGLTDTSRVLVLTTEPPPPLPRTRDTDVAGPTDALAVRPAEHACIATLATLLDTTLAEVATDRAHLRTHTTRTPDALRLKTRVAERLLQGLLRLDAVVLAPSFASARQHRKHAVHTIQAALDEIDAVADAWG